MERRFEEKKDDGPKEMDPYSKPYFIAICIKYMVKIDKPIEVKKSGGATNILMGEEEQTEQKLENFFFNTFRITKSTTFQQLKNQAADFWVFHTLFYYFRMKFLNIIFKFVEYSSRQ